MKVWADNMSPILKDAPEENQFLVAEEDITWVRYPVGMATLSWKRIMESTRRAINSRAFITRRTSLYLRKPF